MTEFAKGSKASGLEWKSYRKKTIVKMARMDVPFRTESREGWLQGQPGDFLAEDGYGGFYPVGAAFHANNYEEFREED